MPSPAGQTVPPEAWVDEQGLVRRVVLTVDMGSVVEAMDLPAGAGPFEVSSGTTMDLFDYGDESIEIEIPTDYVDITDPYREMLDGGPDVGSATPSFD